LNLEVKRGEVLALLGPNGAGKTTTLSMLTDNLAPHAGHVRIGGHDLSASPKAAKRSLGYLPEQPPLYADMRVKAYLAWCAALHGIPRTRRASAVDDACASSGLADVKGRLLGHLSKGYRQRVGIAQAIVHRPSFVVLDEPTSGLDPLQSRDALELIRLLKESAGVLFSTHQLHEVSAVADRVAIIHRGRIAYSGRIGEDLDPESRQIHIELAHPPAPEHIEGLPGIKAIEKLGTKGFLVTAEAGADPREPLARAALAEEWGLLALTPRRPSLEALFTRIVHENHPVSRSAAEARRT
jgi:ABC-2 type transport system ATP-binding protein